MDTSKYENCPQADNVFAEVLLYQEYGFDKYFCYL